MNDISRGAHSSDCTSCYDTDLSWNMSNRYLIGRFLNFDILIAHKFTLFDLKDKLTLYLILYTFLTRTFNLWSKLFCTDDLVDLKSTSITGIYSNLHARLNITASSDNSFHSD